MTGTSPIYSAAVDYRISQQPPGPIGDKQTAVAIAQLFAAVQVLISQQTAGSYNQNTLAVVAGVTLTYGEPVNLFSHSGVINAKAASSTPTVAPCHGFCGSRSGISSGSTGLIILGPNIINLTGLTVGSNYWLAGGGTIATSPDTTAGDIEQYLGIALSTTQLFVNPSTWIQH